MSLASRTQHAWLSVLRRIGCRPRRLRLFHPRARLHLGDAVPSWLYKEIFVHECYATPVALPEAPVIFDVGANIGLASLYFLHRFPRCRLVAFEPNPRAFALLKETLASTAARVELHALALSSRAGRIALYVERGAASPLNASITGRDTRGRDVETVEVETADVRTFLTQRVDLMKMDIEGAELELLALPEIAPSRVRSIVVEIHDIHERREDVRRVVEALLARGYETSAGVDELCARSGSHIVRYFARD